MRLTRKNRRRVEDQPVDYWQSIADALTALLLAVLLVVAILILVIASSSGWFDGAFHNGAGNVNIHDVNGGRYEDDHYGSGGYGGGDQGAGPWESHESAGAGGGAGDYDDPDPGSGEWDDPIRAAVHVTVIDAETNQVIPVEGVTFELHRDGTLQTLSTYYPEKVDYTQYETTPAGTFYLPQKIRSGSYQLKELTAPKGYDPALPVDFSITEDYDWPAPYELTVPLYPCRNAVRIQQIDAQNSAGVAGGAWNVIAAQDVATADGTVRYKNGQVAATVYVGEDGYGTSDQLYLGNYKLEQIEFPEGYAAYQPESTDALAIKVEQKATAEEQAPLHTFTLSKTHYTLRVMDEETKNPIEGAAFMLTPGDKRLTTNKDGVVTFDGLAKSTDFTIRQESAPTGYQTAQDIAFAVDSRGLIDGSAGQDVFVTNYIVRISVDAVGTVLRKPLNGTQLRLMAPDGSLVKEWTSTAHAQVFEGLVPGTYELVGPDGPMQVNVQDKMGTQQVHYAITTVYDIAAAGVGVALLAGVIAAIVWRLRRKKK